VNPRLRVLPVTLPPVHGETIGSYLNRLADANHLTISILSGLLGVARRHRRDDDSPTGWSPDTLTRLSALTGRPAPSLTRALPALHRLRTSPPHIPLAPNQELTEPPRRPACRPCMAHRGIHGLVVRRTPGHECLCPRHQRWLHRGEQHRLDPLPEVLRANIHHRRLARTHHLDAALAYLNAQRITSSWFHAASQPDLQHRWTQRLHLLGDDPYGDPHRPAPDRIDIVTYPENRRPRPLAHLPALAGPQQPPQRGRTLPRRSSRRLTQTALTGATGTRQRAESVEDPTTEERVLLPTAPWRARRP
jgi:hypothetical protein